MPLHLPETRSAVFGIGKIKSGPRIPCRTLIAVHRYSAEVLHHPGQVHEVPGHESGVAVGEVVLRAAGTRVEVGRARAWTNGWTNCDHGAMRRGGPGVCQGGRSEKFGILVDAEQRWTVGREQRRHGGIEVIPPAHPNPGRATQSRELRPIGIVQRRVPGGVVAGHLFSRDLPQALVVQQDVLMPNPYLTAVVSSMAYWPKPPSLVTATTGRVGSATHAPNAAGYPKPMEPR